MTAPSQETMREAVPTHGASLWERVISVIAALTVVMLIGYLAIRNQPFSDPNIIVFIRILLAFSTALLGATIPGMLKVNWANGGAAIRAGGAVALFVLTFFFTPTALRPLPPPPEPHSSPAQPEKLRMGLGLGGGDGHVSVSPQDYVEVSPYPVYFPTIYEKATDTAGPNLDETNALRARVQQSVDWIASRGDVVKCVVLIAVIDDNQSAEYALTTAQNEALVVKGIMENEGVNPELILYRSMGKEAANPLFSQGLKASPQNFNNKVSIFVALK